MRLKQFFSALICLLLTVALFLCAGRFLERRGSYNKNADFYAYEDDFEVLFLGSSRVVEAVAPMELWNAFGITSYNLANYGQYPPTDYWVLKNALDYQHPQLVVMDVTMIDAEMLYYDMFAAQMHDMFDIMPWTRNKYDALTELIPPENRMEYMFPFSLYHTRWREIDESFFRKRTASTEKGAYLDGNNLLEEARVYSIEKPERPDTSAKNRNDTIGKIYLRKSIELCVENGIDVLLIALPVAAGEGEQLYRNSVPDIAALYGIRFFDMFLEADCINFKTDLSDANHHNGSGMRRVTRALGAYITEHYPIRSLKDSAVAEQWNRDYLDYCAFKIEWLKQQQTLYAYLVSMSDEPYHVEITVYDETLPEEALIRELLHNLPDYEIIRAEMPEDEAMICSLTVTRPDTGEQIDHVAAGADRRLIR